MSAIAINAADLAAPTSAFVAVRTTQITVSASATKTGKDFSSMFNSKEESVQIQSEQKTAETEAKTEKLNTVEDTSEKVEGKVDTDASKETTSDVKTEATGKEQKASTTVENEKTDQMFLKASLKVSVTTVSMINKASAVDEDGMQDLMDSMNTTAMEAIASLLQRFAEILEITVDELEGSYEQLDFSFEDVIDAQKLPQLMLNLGKCDELSQVLCEEAPAKIYSDLKEVLNEMFESLDFTAQELTGMITKEMAVNKETALDILPKGFIKLITGDTDDAEGTAQLQNDEANKLPEFTVTKETGSENTNNSKNNENTDLTSEIKTTEKGSDRAKKIESKDGFEEFVKGLENAVKVTDTREIPMIEGKPDIREIVMRVVDAIKLNLSPDKTSIELSLSPQSLGKISLMITSKDGTLTAKISTENEVTKQAIESQLEMLKETIAQQGVRVEAIEVSVSGFTFADSNNAQKGETENEEKKTTTSVSKQIRDGEAGTATQDETVKAEAVPEGSTVNYVA
ncbi:MAG: flagellar hook-length control protein FliK [Lachnospiraceae bacterium]|nr:flagellar hook-length control protein FliK [Lachnospiraceae bacterium]